MASSSSCSHWWHAVIYIPLSVFLAILAIFSSSHSHLGTTQEPLSVLPIPHASTFLANATHALKLSGYTFTAALLRISSDRFLPYSEVTIFAVPDCAISNISFPPWFMFDLLLYHTSPAKISFEALSEMPVGSCLPTTLSGKNLLVTASDRDFPPEWKRRVEINGVLVSHPDIFLDGPYAVHGLSAPFFSPCEGDFLPADMCSRSLGTEGGVEGVKNAVLPWRRIIRLLSLSGFVSFSIGLHSVLDGILEDFGNVSSATIFAPPDDQFAYLGLPSPHLERIVGFHVLPRKVSFEELSEMPVDTVLPTLVPGLNLRIISSLDAFFANRVDIVEPDVVAMNAFVIHGISRPFETLTISNTLS